MENKPAKSFKDLLVWQKAHNLVKSIYGLSEAFPRKEMYSLTSQLRRAAVSVPANIAEGFGRISIKEKVRFLDISRGSLEECRYYLILAEDMKYCNVNDVMDELEETAKLLSSSIKTLSKY